MVESLTVVILRCLVALLTHVPDQFRKKIDDKAEKCIFIGYSYKTKGYKLYNLKTKKVVVNRDITFDKNCVWDRSSEEKNSLPMSLLLVEVILILMKTQKCSRHL